MTDIAALVARLHGPHGSGLLVAAQEAAAALEEMQASIKHIYEAGREAHQAYKDAAARAERAEASLRKANAALELAGAGIIGPNDGELAKSLAEQLVRAEAERDAKEKENADLRAEILALRSKA